MAQLLPLFRFLQAAVHHASKPQPPPQATTLSSSSVVDKLVDSTEQLAATASGSVQSIVPEAGGAIAPALPPVAVPGPLQGQHEEESEGSGLEDMDEDEDEEDVVEEEVDIEEDPGATVCIHACWLLYVSVQKHCCSIHTMLLKQLHTIEPNACTI